LNFSRRKTSDFIDGLMTLRLRHGVSYLARPFLEFMLEHPPEDWKQYGIDDSIDFAINIYACVRKYAAEPDFMGYLLLLQGKISDTIVQDNKSFCSELLKILPTLYEPVEGSKNLLSKKAFFDSLRDVLENKTREQLGEIWPCLPAGEKIPVNVEWLLLDDPHVLSPVVYVLRLQHLEESERLCERLVEVTRPLVKDGVLRFESVDSAFREDQDLSICIEEDIAKAFGTPINNLKKGLETDANKFLELMKHGDMFHMLYYPQLPDDTGDASPGEP
jgi:hypothetical protein